jgi:hypothetical protein
VFNEDSVSTGAAQENDADSLDKINEQIADLLRAEAEREVRAERAAIRARYPATETLLGGDRVTFVKVDPTNEASVARVHSAIAWKYRDNPRPKCRRRRLVAIRIEEFERYMAHRYGRALPDDDAGRHDLTILLNHIAQISDIDSKYMRMHAAARVWTRRPDMTCWMDDAEMDVLIDRIIQKPRRYSAKRLGELTGLTEEEHKLLGITSFWPHTWIKEEVRAKQHERKQSSDRKAKTAKRRAYGVVSREEYLAKSKSRTKPWEAAGFKCRRTWERHMKKAAAQTQTQDVSQVCRSYKKKDSYRGDTPATIKRDGLPVWITMMPVADLNRLVKITTTCGIGAMISKIGLHDRIAA